MTYTTDDFCDQICNNLLCHFDGGSCQDPGSTDRCYGSNTPAANENMQVCSAYHQKTCCSEDAELELVKKYLEGNASARCKVENECTEMIERAVCAPCSPNSNKFTMNTYVQYCSDFADLFVMTHMTQQHSTKHI